MNFRETGSHVLALVPQMAHSMSLKTHLLFHMHYLVWNIRVEGHLMQKVSNML